MSYSDNFPSQRASLLIDFSNGGRIPPNATFSRSDSPIDASKAAASAVHFWSNEKHLSSENLLLDSKTGTGNWTALNVGGAALPTVTADHAAPPSGGANAATRVQLDLSGGTASGDIAMYYQNRSVASGTSATFSVWLKATDGTSTYAAQIIGANGADSDVTITGSWQKFTVTGTSGGANDSYGVRLRGSQTPTNADTADILMWGANLSTTGETVLNATTTQIHREYAPTLKSVATAGQARFEYDPTDGQSVAKGILLEGQATNLLTRSEDVSHSDWAKVNSVVEANAAVAPDGTLTADLWRSDSTAAASHQIYRGVSGLSSGTAYTVSAYFKAAGYNHVSIFFNPHGSIFSNDEVFFNLSTGEVGTKDADITASCENCGGGWYRCRATRTAAASGLGYINFLLAEADSDTTIDGDAYSGVLAWGFQVEASSFASSYLKTEAATVTRAADSMSLATADIGYTGGPVSVVVEANMQTPSTNSNNRAVLELAESGSTANRLLLYNYGGRADGVYAVADGSSTALFSGTINTDAYFKTSVSMDTNSIARSVNGGAITEDTSGQLPSNLDTLSIGCGNSVNPLDGHIKRVALYSEALTDTNLQALTS